MTISLPDYWKEPFFDKGPKYDKIKELIDATNVLEGTEDHGNLAGLADDDHTQYLLHNGTRALTGNLNLGTHLINNVVNPVSAQDASTKNYVDGKTYLEGVIFATGTQAKSDVLVSSDGVRVVRNNTNSGWFMINVALPSSIKLLNGSILYPEITEATAYWWQGTAAAQLDRFYLRRLRSDTASASTVVNDTTNRGAAGNNSYTWSSLTGRLDINYNLFNMLVYYIFDISFANFRFMSVKLTYNYA